MSRLSDLLTQLAKSKPDLAEDLRRETDVLARRRPFGLNFERHVPETVQLPGRKIRRGDKVVFRPPAAGSDASVDDRTWVVTGIEGTGEQREARLIVRDNSETPETVTKSVVDLVVVAEFRDPIYPGLRSTGVVEQGGDKPAHLVINGENFHVLEALNFAFRGQVDCVYIDPPYNTRDKDWKYNNDYVDADDMYRHSKWLAMMERRLLLARELLRPDDSVLIVTIDEKEHLRLGLLLQQTFPEATMQMVSVAINPAAIARGREFRRADEYYFFVMLGVAAPQAVELGGDWITAKGRTHRGEIRWDLLRRSAEGSARADRPGMFYPFFVDPSDGRVHSIGDALPLGQDRTEVQSPAGTVAVWPIRKNGTEGRWRLGPETARKTLEKGYIRVGTVKGETTPIYYLTTGEQKKIADGIYKVLDRAPDGSVVTSTLSSDERRIVPSTQWRVAAHDSTQYGSRMLLDLLPGRRFPFPKSLYAVEDALRFFLADKPEALVLDFFAGSGTTTHAVMRLNRQYGGTRRSICVTNNEVSADEAKGLAAKGLRPGDADWEAVGISEYITKPRVRAAITGETPDGKPLEGDYKFADEFPFAEGFEENAEFFDLTYEDPERVKHGLGFEAIAPLLWIRAGSKGRRIDTASETFELADTYGVLFGVDAAAGFVAAVKAAEGLRVAFVVTDDETQFQVIAAQLPAEVETVRLYSAYLENFRLVASD